MFSKEIAPAMCLPIGVGRMDDIWMSYMAERIMREFDKAVYFTGATVTQDRNPHDLSKDLEQETIGYKHTLSFINFLNSLELVKTTVLDMYGQIVNQLHTLEFYPKESISFQKAWINDLKKLEG